jgi:hydrogenase-4 membrane subunit HyfE
MQRSACFCSSPQAIPTLIRASSSFTVWSSVVHAAIMGVQSINDTARGHLLGDVPALILAAIILGVLMPRTAPQGDRDNLARPDLTPA